VNKQELDAILEKHRVQPVGNGYIDLIVRRKNLQAFVRDIVDGGYPVQCVTWWEWCPKNEKNKFGLGGPKSEYFDGWFAELAVHDDNTKELYHSSEQLANKLIDLIESKEMNYPGLKTTYKEADWLTPALWLEVPDSWINKNNA
jgi:hypothetical protein